MRNWIAVVGPKTAYIEPGSLWVNGYVESFNARLRDELLNGEILYSLRVAQLIIESWHRHSNAVRSNQLLGNRPSAPEASILAPAAWPHARATLAPSPTQHIAQGGAMN